MVEKISKHGYGPWMTDNKAVPTRLYYYWENVASLMGLENAMYGNRRGHQEIQNAAALPVPEILDLIRGGDVFAFIRDLATILPPEKVKDGGIEVDNDVGSPYFGCLRWVFVVTKI